MTPVDFKLPYCYKTDLLDAGCDEAGRGCFAGPVCAAAVILPRGFHHPALTDSKLVPPSIREELKIYIQQNAIAYSIAMIDVQEIDSINILKASQKAMHIALDTLSCCPEFITVDGNYFLPYKKIEYQCIVKGDSKFAHIAAASILAKTHRDNYMQQLHQEFPHYNWFSNKGYGTKEHRAAIKKYGICAHHRKSFNIQHNQLTFFN